MDAFVEVKALLREKSGKKLAVFSVIVFLLITVIVFFATFKHCENIQLKLLDEYLWEIPGIIESRENEMLVRSRVYEDDAVSRAGFGLMIFGEEDALTDAEKLERVRSTVSAASVSLLDEQGKLLSTTGYESPEEVFLSCVKDLEPDRAYLELYPAPAKDDKDGVATDLAETDEAETDVAETDLAETDEAKTGKKEGKLFVRLPLTENAQRSLVFEFSCEQLLEMYNSMSEWSDVLELLLSRVDVAAFTKTGDKLEEYPMSDFSPEESSRLHKELTNIFQNSESFQRTGDGRASKLITLLGRRYLASLMHYSQEEREDTDILLTVALKNIVRNCVFIAAAISAIIGFGIVLLQIYVLRRLQKKKTGESKEAFSHKQVWKTMKSGIVVVLVVTVLFSGMLLTLEDRTNATFITMTKRMYIESEIDWRQSQRDSIQATFEDVYRTRTQVLADFLAEHPDYRTREGLEELSRIAKTDYLMLFDSAGEELVSSNSYTGFSVGNGLSEDYRAVLMGYPDVVAGPSEDPYTGRMQLGTAILMTDGKDQADGFLLGVYAAGELNAQLKQMSYKNTVNNYEVRGGEIAAVIDDEDGRFVAHTVPDMIGQKAEDYLGVVKPGSNFEGFGEYKGKSMCVSASAKDGRTLLFMTPEHGNAYVKDKNTLLAVAVLLILALLYFPIASRLVSQAMEEAEGRLPQCEEKRMPIAVFSDGYSFFLTLFAVFALIASANGWWTSFDYVFSRGWSKGIHLYSLWAALFILTITLLCVSVMRSLLRHMERRLSLQSRTAIRLVNSLVTYAAVFFLFFYILDMFGVNTTAMLASAGVVAIAVGMGAQSMAADLLAGFFMMLEGSIHVGDLVNLGGTTGRVTDMGIRTTEITDEEGNVTILNNSKATPVRNMSRNNAQKEQKSDPKSDQEKEQKSDHKSDPEKEQKRK